MSDTVTNARNFLSVFHSPFFEYLSVLSISYVCQWGVFFFFFSSISVKFDKCLYAIFTVCMHFGTSSLSPNWGGKIESNWGIISTLKDTVNLIWYNKVLLSIYYLSDSILGDRDTCDIL